jgi:hypothetical protein
MGITDPKHKPDLSTTVTVLGAGGIPADAIALRGYLGRSDIVDRLLSLLKPALSAADYSVISNVISPGSTLRDVIPWRIYLSPMLDRYVDFKWEDVLGWQKETEPDRDDAVTVWLRSSVRYMVVEIAPVVAATGYVRGDLIEDYMKRSESQNVVWSEQEYGPAAGKRTFTTCVG